MTGTGCIETDTTKCNTLGAGFLMGSTDDFCLETCVTGECYNSSFKCNTLTGTVCIATDNTTKCNTLEAGVLLGSADDFCLETCITGECHDYCC